MSMRSRTLGQLSIRDERAFQHIHLYGLLKNRLLEDGFLFRIAKGAGWQRALFLNLAFWNAAEPSDVLEDDRIDADVVAHAAWHHVARKMLSGPPTTNALFLGESIASAFDIYLVGRILGQLRSSSFLKTQVPAMAKVAADAGLSSGDFQELLQTVVADPEGAFEDLRQLLFDASCSLVACHGLDQAAAVFASLDQHRFAPLLHHYELSTWILHARAYADSRPDPAVQAIDQQLRAASSSLTWLERHWLGNT